MTFIAELRSENKRINTELHFKSQSHELDNAVHQYSTPVQLHTISTGKASESKETKATPIQDNNDLYLAKEEIGLKARQITSL